MLVRISSSISSSWCSPSISTPDRGSSRIKIWGSGSRAMARSTRWSWPPDRPPMGLSSRSSPWTRARQRATSSRWRLGTGRQTGQRVTAAAKKSSTLTGSPGQSWGLGHIADEGRVPGRRGERWPRRTAGRRAAGRGEGDGAGVWHLPQDAAEQGGLARPVGADEGGDLSAVEVEGHILQDVLPLGCGPTGPPASGSRRRSSPRPACRA